MKKLFLSLFLGTFVFSVMLANNGDNNPRIPSAGDCARNFNNIRLEGNMLAFTDVNHYRNTLECLTIAYEAYNDSLNGVYGHLTDEQYEIVEERLGLDEDKPLKDFETRFRFFSLRADIDAKERRWLMSNELDMQNDPDDHPLLDDVERTLVNPAGLVKIGDQVYDLSGIQPATGTEASRVFDECNFIGDEKRIFPYNNGANRFKVKVSFYNTVLYFAARSKVVNYKRKLNGGWKKQRTRLFITHAGTTYSGRCEDPVAFSAPDGPKYQKKLAVSSVAFFKFREIKPGKAEFCASGVVTESQIAGTTCY